MKCPVCKALTSRLEPCEHEPGLASRECPVCRGQFVSFESYFAWVSRHGAAHPATPEVAEGEAVGVDSAPGKLCPSCGRYMTRMKVSLDVPFQIDRCGGCAGMWFDGGEWDHLRSGGLHRRLHLYFAESWQRRLHEAEQHRAREDRYRELLGQEFYAKARELKDWLDVHPRRDVLIAYLMDADKK